MFFKIFLNLRKTFNCKTGCMPNVKFIPLKICHSFSWQENVTLKVIINNSRVATPSLKSCKVLFLEEKIAKNKNGFKYVKGNVPRRECLKIHKKF